MEFAKQTENGYEQFTTCTESKLKAYLSLSRSCKLRPVGDNGKIGLQLYIKDFFESREWTNIVFILLDNILGEFDAEMFLSYIDKKPLNESEKDAFLAIFELPKVIQNFKQEVYN